MRRRDNPGRTVDLQPPSLFAFDGPDRLGSPARLAATLAAAAAPGHFDELRGGAAPTAGSLAAPWQRFFDHLGPDGFADLGRRTAALARQIRDNGVTFNVHTDSDRPQRPWSLDLFPLIVEPAAWQRIEAGVLQRVRVLDAVMADAYGRQDLIGRGLLPPALLHGHPGYLRSLHGHPPAGGTHLHIAAFDLARGPDGHWWVVSQRTQAPSGLGYLLENRLAISRQFPQAFEAMGVQRLASPYRALVDGLKQMAPGGADPHVALLTPGPYNETYFEHVYLARHLGLTLVEGSDLTVRNERLYLKTLGGLQPVHGLLKRVDDEFLDPLELRSDSRLGVPGLLQAVRAGNVLVANAPGSGFLESPALLGFLPALARHLLGEELVLPALPTWWCGERAAMDAAVGDLGSLVVKSTYPASDSHPGFDAVLGQGLDQEQRDAWTGRILRDSDAYTLQHYLPLSQVPTWAPDATGMAAPAGGRIVPRSVVLRVFAMCDGPHSWRVLPGGMARIVAGGTGAIGGLGQATGITSMQRGGSSADAWVLTDGPIDTTPLAPPPAAAGLLQGRQRQWPVTSRAAEHLFWFGRYTERAENTVRLARLVLEVLNADEPASLPVLDWIGTVCEAWGLVIENVPGPQLARRVFERALVAALGQTGAGAGDDEAHATSVGWNLVALREAAQGVRERLSTSLWKAVEQAERDFLRRAGELAGEFAAAGSFPAVDALRLLESCSLQLAAITGAQTDRMTRDDGWRLLAAGRHVERLGFFAGVLDEAFATGAVQDEAGFMAVVTLFDSNITFHGRYQQRRDVAALVELLVLDRDNPRALAWVAHTLRGRLARLAGNVQRGSDAAEPLEAGVPDPDAWTLEGLLAGPGDAALRRLFGGCAEAAWHTSDAIGARYFSHVADVRRSIGT